MKIREKILIAGSILFLLAISTINFVSIQSLKTHHVEKYDKYTCVLLPWKMMFTPSIKCEKNLDNF